MSSEGQLKKRINSYSCQLRSIEEIAQLKNAPDKRKVVRDWISVVDVRRCWKAIFRDLDEAKKELFSLYPTEPLLQEALRKIAETNDKEIEGLTYAKMFVKLEKWFGEP